MRFTQLLFYAGILHLTSIVQGMDDPSRCVVDQIPHEVAATHIFGDVLATHPTQAHELLTVSRYFLTVVNDPRAIKKAVSKRDRALSSYEHARAMNTIAAQYYVETNEKLCNSDEKEYSAIGKKIYFFTLKANPYADVNYFTKPVSNSSGVTRAESKLLRHCLFPDQKNNWVIDLLKVGADPNRPYA